MNEGPFMQQETKKSNLCHIFWAKKKYFFEGLDTLDI